MRVMPAAPSREPSAQRGWSFWPNRSGRPSWTTRAGVRNLAARAWSGHRLFVIVLVPAVLLRVDAELGYRWQAWFNDSFEYISNTIHTGTLATARNATSAGAFRSIESPRRRQSSPSTSRM